MNKTIELHKRWKDNPSKGEVFTPEGLVREMLDKIPTSVWENPTSTFLDPCMGKGTFLIDILRRLTTIYGYSKEDAMSRIYGYDVRVKYINYLKRGGFVNVFHKDFLKENIEMKFDVIVGNPPYQDNEKERGINGGTNRKLWMFFLDKSLELLQENGFMAILVPSTWAAGSKNPHKKTNIFQDIIKKKKIININMDENNYFNVGIQISSIVLQNTEDNGDTIKIENTEFNVSKFEILPKDSSPTALSIFNKLINFPKMKFEFVRKSFTKNELRDNEDGTYIYPTYVGKNGIKFSSSQTKFDGNRKILVHRMSFGSGGLQIFLDDNGTITPCYSSVYLLSDNDDGENICKLLESKLYNFLFNNLKYTQYNECRALSQLPFVNDIVDYSDAAIFEYFGLETNEVNYILENV